MQQTIMDHAKQRGADLVLIGMLSENEDEDSDTFEYSFFGPKTLYLFSKRWQGWRFDFEEWNDGADVVSFGTKIWNDSEYMFPRGLMLQSVYLTRQVGPEGPAQ